MVRAPQSAPPAVVQPLVQRARQYAEHADAAATKRAYRTQWRTFSEWCQQIGYPALPVAPEVLALYLTKRADEGGSNSTLEQVLAAVARAHERAGHESPTSNVKVQVIWRGIRRDPERQAKTRPRKAAPLSPAVIRQMIQGCGEGLGCLRNRALLLLGFAAALRRGELVALDVEDIEFNDDGLIVIIRRSKTDQEGLGGRVPVPFGSDRATCPVRALKDWLAQSAIADGAIFRGVRKGDRLTVKRLDGGDVARIVQRTAKRAGIKLDQLSGHSLRVGLGTSAAKAKKPLQKIREHMRHKSLEQTLQYIREAELFDDDNAASGIGL